MDHVFVWTPSDVIGLGALAIIVVICFIGIAIEAGSRLIDYVRKARAKNRSK